jgi:hypothetical protein
LAMNKGNPRSSHFENVFLDFPSSFNFMAYTRSCNLNMLLNQSFT